MKAGEKLRGECGVGVSGGRPGGTEGGWLVMSCGGEEGSSCDVPT